MVVAQTAVPIAVVGTVALFALFLSVTAHIAARNVLGDVPLKAAFLVGPGPAAVAIVTAAFGVLPILGLLVAVAVDALLIWHVYDLDSRLTALVTGIHFVVSVILGAVLFGVLTLINTAPV